MSNLKFLKLLKLNSLFSKNVQNETPPVTMFLFGQKLAYFTFDEELYEQVEKVAMESPLSSVLANSFIEALGSTGNGVNILPKVLKHLNKQHNTI
ncbi:hypothetical protein Trydic_g6844 [Trypoxylus dichotomus]